MMWMWRSVLCVSLVCGLALDSNTIRSSSSEQLDRSHGNQTETSANKRPTRPCATPDCYVPPVTDRLTTPGHNRAGCSNRAQRRTVPQDRQADRRRHKDTDTQQDTDSFNRTKAPEMSSCVRSGDCAAGLCCVRYLTGRRCQRIPGEGEACLLRGSSKQKRNLERCDCDKGLTCTPVSWAESAKNKGQGVCLPRPRQGQRKTRHSGKKRRTAERSC